MPIDHDTYIDSLFFLTPRHDGPHGNVSFMGTIYRNNEKGCWAFRWKQTTFTGTKSKEKVTEFNSRLDEDYDSFILTVRATINQLTKQLGMPSSAVITIRVETTQDKVTSIIDKMADSLIGRGTN